MGMQIDVWTFRQVGTDGQDPADLVGYSVEAADGSIGKVDRATYETGSSYVVVDTGPWIFGARVVLPAHVIENVDHDDRTVYVDRTRDEIKAAPTVQDVFPAESPEARENLGDYYRSFYR